MELFLSGEVMETKQETISPKETIRQGRIQKLVELNEKGINAYPYTFDKNADCYSFISLICFDLLYLLNDFLLVIHTTLQIYK